MNFGLTENGNGNMAVTFGNQAIGRDTRPLQSLGKRVLAGKASGLTLGSRLLDLFLLVMSHFIIRHNKKCTQVFVRRNVVVKKFLICYLTI